MTLGCGAAAAPTADKDLTWGEFSKTCYDRLGRSKAAPCPSGSSRDLYELACPLLDPNMKLNHHQQQYVLRAVAQRLKNPPWDWGGPGRPLQIAIDAGRTDLVYVMLQGST